VSSIKLFGKIIIRGKIRCETGLRIGGARETLEIGGIENIIVRDPVTDEPYIPGASLKGKMRSLLEKAYSKAIDAEREYVHSCSDAKCEVCRVFGVPVERAEEAEGGVWLTRLIVRDCKLTEEARKKLSGLDLEVPFAEVKWENTINRITSRANPRQVERVPSGSEFEFEMAYNVYEPEDLDYLKIVFEGMRLLEDDYLGGYGSRGYGKIKFSEIKVVVNDAVNVYRMGKDGVVAAENKRPNDLLREFDKLRGEIERGLIK
jgi:CRISPR-associated protein Csm3